jgi:hypothetical protein
MSLILESTASQPWGTPGQYLIDGLGYYKTLEPVAPVIPAGDYILQIYFSPEHGYFVPRFVSPTDPTFADRCLESHIGNIWADTHGCVLVGDGYGDINCAEAYDKIDPKTGKMDPRHYLGIVHGLTNSAATFKKMMHDGKIDFGKPVYKNGKITGYVGGSNITVIRAAS